jgi:hypothetical protein
MALLTVTDCLIGKVTGGVITGLDGGIWSSTPGFYGNPMEFANMANAFEPNSNARYKGIIFQNELYVITSIDDQSIVAQRSNHSLIMLKCPECLVIGFHDEQMPYNKCFQAISDLAQRLRSSELDELIFGDG